MEGKPRINLAIIGHIDAGKSTLVGHFMFKCGLIDQRKLTALETEAKHLGKQSFKYAFVTDTLKEERQRGISINYSTFKFETPHYLYNIIDAPGHKNYVKNMITGASQADIALLVVDSTPGGLESGISPLGQTREHAILARSMGIQNLIVVVNKMDDQTVNYQEERFDQVVLQMKEV